MHKGQLQMQETEESPKSTRLQLSFSHSLVQLIPIECLLRPDTNWSCDDTAVNKTVCETSGNLHVHIYAHTYVTIWP